MMANKPDNGHVHEVVHTLFIVQNNVNDFVLGNDLFKAKKKTKAARKKVEKAMNLLYQAYALISDIEFK